MADARLNLAFAGDRDVAVEALAVLLELGDRPAALLLPDPGRASHDAEVIGLCERAGVSPAVFRASQLTDPSTIDCLRGLRLDYIVSVHFPHILRRPLLDLPGSGVLNLHPSYLPYNRGWHTPTWAILDGTPAGASLHFVDESVDTGDVVCRRQIDIDPADTAHTLYLKLKALEVEVFRQGWQQIRSGCRTAIPQCAEQATVHRRQSLFDPAVQRIDLDAVLPTSDLLRRLRALTTNRLEEAAYFVDAGRKYRVQVTITPDNAV